MNLLYIPGANTNTLEKWGCMPHENVKDLTNIICLMAYNVTYEIMQLAKEREGYYMKNTNEYFESLEMTYKRT